MEQNLLPTELILNHSQQSLGNLYIAWTPQPGACVDFDGQTYAVLERRHRYQLKANRYCLSKITLYVQVAKSSEEISLVGDRWVIGNIRCRYNAGSELLRCAVNPAGPCQECNSYQPASD
ncbi:MAG: hypothetical protein HC886_23295 [Leptolyngbyaceae cyanobacterium SM1_1_3]|nr:hypothetical protein [Leptolyngbyaceae cyanobacterium SM1_1_3]NJM85222.1 hypothetical protein [Leptolyngbyaceae cyanobacterium RM2_2_21]NJN02283.1 hypothetical protein [Leptolyngbyaceae cyanobacterium RM1_1_2]NJO08436.1 hypothetical protein [Leptolyngbyaceae cyanobacterium SL_1_1]